MGDGPGQHNPWFHLSRRPRWDRPALLSLSAGFSLDPVCPIFTVYLFIWGVGGQSRKMRLLEQKVEIWTMAFPHTTNLPSELPELSENTDFFRGLSRVWYQQVAVTLEKAQHQKTLK